MGTQRGFTLSRELRQAWVRSSAQPSPRNQSDTSTLWHWIPLALLGEMGSTCEEAHFLPSTPNLWWVK